MPATFTRPGWEVSDVFRRFGMSYVAKHGVLSSHLRVMHHIQACRTAALGGHMEACDSCGHERPVYNSCRDRHCPKCQTMTKEKWLAARKAELLPVDYYHKVFTLPHELNALVLANKRVVLGILFRAVAETLLSFGRDERSRLGGKTGFTLVLHTWNQQLLDHFHIHCVIPAGVLTKDGAWVAAKSDRFLFSVKALAVVFRAKFLAHLRAAYDDGELIFPGALAAVAEPAAFADLLARPGGKKWVVYSKAPFGGPERVLEYLGRYTHRVAISNHRLVDVADETVAFTYRDRADGAKTKTMTVSGHEFVRRFLLHVLPRGFTRIRHYGLLASRSKAENLVACRAALDAPPPPSPAAAPKDPVERLLALTGIDVLKCKSCAAGRMHRVHKLPDPAAALAWAPVVASGNTS